MKHDVSLFIDYFCLINIYKNIFIVNIQIIVNLVYFILKRVQSEMTQCFALMDIAYKMFTV